MQTSEIPALLQTIGVIVYSFFTIIVVIWGGIFIDRARRISRRYYAMSCTCVCAAIFAANLSLIATDPIWISRITLTVTSRLTAGIGVIALAWYTIAVLREEYRRDKIVRKNQNSASSHSNTLTAL